MKKDVLLRQKFVLACLTSAALMLAACDDDASGDTTQPGQCGEQVCTENQECVEGKCQDKVKDPCAACTDKQECVDGACQDKAEDPCDLCTDGQECVEGVCHDLCGSEICGDHQKCDEASQTCVDDVVEDPCSKCLDSQVCVNGECMAKDPCDGVQCPDNHRCDSAKNGECVEIDPCEGVICNDGQACLKAQCIDTDCIIDGAEKDCGEGKVCSKGSCVDDGCQDVSCDEGWQCLKGVCVETACIEYFCEEGRSCKGGECVDNECLDIVCDEGLICSKGNCTYEACLGKEACTVGKACNIEGTCVFIEEPAVSIDEPEDKVTDESGKTVTLSVRLNNQPTMDVRVTCEVETDSPNQEVTASCEEIVFNADNWQLEQSIIVTGIDDYVKDGDQTYQIKVMTLSEDIDFAELVAESVSLTNVDKTTPGVVFSETVLTTYEDQTQPPATFTITLASIPTADVRVSFSSSAPAEGTVSPLSVTFNKDNWNVPQVVSVKGVDDNVEEKNKGYTIFFAPTQSDDLDYHEFTPKPIKVTNIDNDISGLNINIPAEEYVVKEGQSNIVLVKLNTQPKKEVKVAMATSHKEEAEFDTAEVTLNAENWNTGVEVRLMGVSDYFIDGNKAVKLSFTSTSEDESYNLGPIEYDATVVDTDTGNVVMSLGDSPIVKEGDSMFVSMSLMLASRPTEKVTVELSVADSSELKIDKTSVTFTPDLWDITKDVLVSSVDDAVVDGNIKSKILMNLASGDKNFNGQTNEVEFTTLDDDVAGFNVSSNAASFPENSGSTISMKVALLSQPTADVTVAVTSSDASELIVTSAQTLTFTTTNWQTPQTVSVKVADDKIADGTQTAYVKFVGTSTDKNFNNITGQSLLYTIIDDEMPSIVMTTQNTTIPQASPSTVASLRLGIEPTSNVTVNLKSDTAAISFSPSSLTFTTANWDKPQNVTVNADFAGIASASSTATISAKASASNSYNNIASSNIVLNLVKVPLVQNFAYTGNVQNVSLPKGKYKLEVWGAQGGNAEDNGGRGGYASGIINLPATTTFYIYVGGQGGSGTGCGSETGIGGFNGGAGTYDGGYAGGGGGTDMRIAQDSLYARVIVAGGGGGAGGGDEPYYGGVGGGLSGGSGVGSGSYGDASGGTQTAPGTTSANKGSFDSDDGVFGAGGKGYGCSGSGGGGGWYGGGGATHGTGAGGSGYVYTSSTASNYPTGCKLNSTYYLTSTQLTAGNSAFPAPAGGTETGHMGNGYARISVVTQ